MESHILTELTNLETLAKLRLERIRELEEQIRSRRDMADAFAKDQPHSAVGRDEKMRAMSNRLTAEADDLQRRLDAILAAPLDDYPLNGEEHSIDSQSNW